MRSTRPRATPSRLTSNPAAAAARVGFGRACANAGDAVSRAIATSNAWALKHVSLSFIAGTSMSVDFFLWLSVKTWQPLYEPGAKRTFPVWWRGRRQVGDSKEFERRKLLQGGIEGCSRFGPERRMNTPDKAIREVHLRVFVFLEGGKH